MSEYDETAKESRIGNTHIPQTQQKGEQLLKARRHTIDDVPEVGVE